MCGSNPLDVTGWLGSAGYRTIVAKDLRKVTKSNGVKSTRNMKTGKTPVKGKTIKKT